MLTTTHDLREDVDELLGRLARIDAQRVMLVAVADSLGGAESSRKLAAVLDQVQRDLMLASREAGRVHEHASAGGTR